MTTRGQFYARKNGGGARRARRAFTCMQFGCFKKVEVGEAYFDTQEPTTWPKMKRICLCCADVTLAQTTS